MEKIYKNLKFLAVLAIFCFANGMAMAQSCQWKVRLSGSYGDETSWQLRDAQGSVLLSGGPYTYGFIDEKTVQSEGPVTFYIETLGVWLDNIAQYDVSNSNGKVITGTISGGVERTFSNIKCSDLPLAPSNGCLTSFFNPKPFDLYTPLKAGIPEAITVNGYAGEYSMVKLTAGTEYKFSSSNQKDFITIGDENGETILTSGTASVIYTPTQDRIIRFYTHIDAFCNYVDIFRTRYVQRGTAAPEDANPNYACFQGDGLKSNGFENAFSITAESPYQNVDDFIVENKTVFNLKYFRLNVATFVPVTEIFLKIYKDDNGKPFEEFITTPVVVPTSQILRGYNNLGFPVYELAVVLPENIALESGRYWIQPQAIMPGFNEAYWEMTSTGSTGNYVLSRVDNDPWIQDQRNYNGVFFVAGECASLAVSDEMNEKLTIYPNPVNDFVNITGGKIDSAEIYSITGQKVRTVNAKNNKADLTFLSKGIYILHTESEGRKQQFKLIKE